MAVHEKETAGSGTNGGQRQPLYCALPPQPVRELPADMHPGRVRAIVNGSKKWTNRTVLHYWFFDGPEEQIDAVRGAFQEWKDLGLGLEFVEVSAAAEAEVRIAFEDDGSWSYVGKDVLDEAATKPTMNFGWDLTDDFGHTTALHEIGHTLGLPHEHQNPFAGIVWDEEAVYADLGGPPNNWDRPTVFNNVLRKLSRNEVDGSSWDPNSVMEYEFGPGLIKEPQQYGLNGVHPAGGLSDFDKEWVLKWYPGDAPEPAPLAAFESRPLTLKDGEQADLAIVPDATREYDIGTFGATDTVMVLFEEIDGEPRYVAGTDDSGTDDNGRLKVKLFEQRRYILRLRLYWAGGSGATAVMYW
jgi:hypothetical protein